MSNLPPHNPPRRRLVLAYVSIVMVLLLVALRADATIDITLQMQLGNPSGAIVDTNNHNHYLVQRTVEALDYSDNLGEPVWASWDLTAGDVGTNSRSANFFTDTNLPANFYRVTDNDYNGVGATNVNLNRGHLCPSEDRTDTRADNDLVFFMSNIMPQSAVNNQGVWDQFENYCRSLLSTNELLIICGPCGFGTNRIPSGKAYVPDYVWKIAVVVPTNSGTALSRITNSTRVIALKIPNTQQATNLWQDYVTSVNQLQVDTGFTFFTALPAGVASVLRGVVDGQTNPPPVIYAFSPTNGAAYTNVFITGTNFSAATAVAFNGVGASFTVNSATQITAVVPTNGTSGLISITTGSGTAISSNSFTVIGGPVVTVYPTNLLAGWDVSGCTNYGVSPLAAATNSPNMTVVTGLSRGSGVTTSGSAAARGWGGTGFTNVSPAAAAATNEYVSFTLAANAGYVVSYTSVSRFDYRRSTGGPTNGVLQYRVGLGAFVDVTNLSYPVANSGASIGPIDLAGIAPLQNLVAGTNVTFRIVNCNGGSGGTWYVFDSANSSAPDLALQGVVVPAVVPVPPALAIAFTNSNSMIITWPAAAAGFGLQQNADLTTTNWTAVTNAVSPAGDRSQVILPCSSVKNFFRLVGP